MKTQYEQITNALISVSVAISNEAPVGFESRMAQHKLEEARMWFEKCMVRVDTQQTLNFEAEKTQLPKVEEVQTPKVEEAQTPKLPTKEELIFAAKKFGAVHGPDKFISILRSFNAGTVSQLFSFGEEVVLKFMEEIKL
jgi:pyruvate carboxylase